MPRPFLFAPGLGITGVVGWFICCFLIASDMALMPAPAEASATTTAARLVTHPAMGMPKGDLLTAATMIALMPSKPPMMANGIAPKPQKGSQAKSAAKLPKTSDVMPSPVATPEFRPRRRYGGGGGA